SGVDLWVVYVDTFTNPSSPQAWGDQVALDNGLGINQYLLAISTEGRQFYLSGAEEGPVTFDELDAIEQDRIGPALQQNDWVGGAIAAADGLTAAAGTTGGSCDGDAEPGGSGGGSFLPVLL